MQLKMKTAHAGNVLGPSITRNNHSFPMERPTILTSHRSLMIIQLAVTGLHLRESVDNGLQVRVSAAVQNCALVRRQLWSLEKGAGV